MYFKEYHYIEKNKRMLIKDINLGKIQINWKCRIKWFNE